MTEKEMKIALLEELLQEAIRFGGILPIRVLRNKLKEAQEGGDYESNYAERRGTKV